MKKLFIFLTILIILLSACERRTRVNLYCIGGFWNFGVKIEVDGIEYIDYGNKDFVSFVVKTDWKFISTNNPIHLLNDVGEWYYRGSFYFSSGNDVNIDLCISHN